MSVNISIVILHYNNAQMTEDYIDNLSGLNWEGLRHHIVVVDNASPDGSGLALKKKYTGRLDIMVLLNRENLGFAKGNNVGIVYSSEQLGAELIAVSNNDIIIEDRNFFQKLWRIYVAERSAVIGPDIFSLKKEVHQSPIRNKLLSEKDVREKIDWIDRMLKRLFIIQKLHLYDFISRVKRAFGKKSGSVGYQYEEKQKNVVLQGAFFVLSKEYMKAYPHGLYDRTFLYMEEDILAHLCNRRKLETLYDPKIKVKHIDGYSTLKRSGDRCSKYIFELQETKKSCKVLLQLMKDLQ